MYTTLRRVLIGLIAVAVAGCGGSGSGGDTSNGAPGELAACSRDSSGACKNDKPGPPAPTPEPQCVDDTQCPALRAACSVCADGTAACPRSVCENGQCNVTVAACPQPSTCGGIAGGKCAEGYACVDDANDTCDPESGADCPGICVPDNRPPFCGGIAGFACPDGEECVDDPGDNCDPANGGADCGGICQPIAEPTCQSDADCPQLRVPCPICPDGTSACPQSICVNGQCSLAFPTCPRANPCGGIAGTPCKEGYECVDDPDDTCDPVTGADCPGMCTPVAPPPPRPCGGIVGATCPDGFECVDDRTDDCDPANGGADCGGICAPVNPGQCKTDEECVSTAGPCAMCADGTAACPKAICENGQCAAIFPGCSEPKACGGIAGKPCEPGFDCTDDPNDRCDPSTGADCAGVCIPARPPLLPRCGGFAGSTCPVGFECIDDPADECDPANGSADCFGICQPTQTVQCKSDAECPAVGAPCSVCADGTYACPRSYCKEGQCGAVIESCTEPQP